MLRPTIYFAFRTDKRKLDDLLLPRIQDLSSLFDVGNRVTLLMLVRILFIRQFYVIVAVIPIVFVIPKKKQSVVTPVSRHLL